MALLERKVWKKKIKETSSLSKDNVALLEIKHHLRKKSCQRKLLSLQHIDFLLTLKLIFFYYIIINHNLEA